MHILVVGDYFSKWVDAIPVRNQQATIVAQFIERVITIFSCPTQLHSDRGTNFQKYARYLVSRKRVPLHTDHSLTDDRKSQSDNRVHVVSICLQKSQRMGWLFIPTYDGLAIRRPWVVGCVAKRNGFRPHHKPASGLGTGEGGCWNRQHTHRLCIWPIKTARQNIELCTR